MRPRASSLPPEPFRGSFVGREADIASIERLVADGARLITLLGPGGVGKTRLLYGLGRALASRPKSHALAWCDLSSARSAGDVVTCVATAISGVALGAATTTDVAVERVARALARRASSVLLLDNLEQLEASALPLLAAWLGAAPGLVVVATSRVRLGVTGEILHRVEPLSLGAPEGAEAPAMRLFEDRARAVRGDFSEEERAAASRIVALLEGMPLALEMAATRLCMLRPEELLERLSRPLAVLTGTASDLDRHASLSRVLDGSWELLSSDERRMLAELGVFVGGLTLESAEAVTTVALPTALPILQRLIDSSLLRPMTSRGRRARHAPYEVVREYALERLAADGRLVAIQRRHARHFVAWGEGRMARMGIDAAAATAALQDLVDDEANLSAAAAFLASAPSDALVHAAVTRGTHDISSTRGTESSLRLRLLSVLEPVRMLRGQLDPWILDLEDALSADPAAPVPIRARATLALARGLHDLGRTERARVAYERASAAAREGHEATLESLACTGLGRLVASLGEWRHAQALFVEARAIPNAGKAAHKLATACFEFYGLEGEGDDVRIAEAVSDYVEVCRFGADPRELVFWLVQLARTESEIVRAPELAVAHLEEALALARKLGDVRGEGYALFALGTHEVAWGRCDDARATLESAVRLLGEAGSKRFEGWALGFLGVGHALRDRWSEGLAALERAASLLAEVGDAPREAHWQAFASVCHARLGSAARAEEALGRASALAPPTSRYHGWTIELCRAQLDVMRGSEPDGAEHLEIARALLRRAGWPSHRDASALSGVCEWPWGVELYEPRLAAELLDRAIAAFNGTSLDETALLVAPDGSFFVLPTGERVATDNREKLQRILVRLAEERIERPGLAVTAASLIEVGWAGERMKASAASNRLHVALDTLRKLGLRGLLARGDGGWMFAPDVACRWASRQKASASSGGIKASIKV